MVMVGGRNNLAAAIQFEVKVDLFEWLTLTSKGQSFNFSTGVAAATILQQSINPPEGADYLLFHGIQWDGITPGTVTFELRGGPTSVIAGFAIQQFIQDELFITDKGRPIRLTVNNGSVAPIVLNLDYIALPAQIWEREVLPNLSPVIPGGY
jgi:hypothetical protein